MQDIIEEYDQIRSKWKLTHICPKNISLKTMYMMKYKDRLNKSKSVNNVRMKEKCIAIRFNKRRNLQYRTNSMLKNKIKEAFNQEATLFEFDKYVRRNKSSNVFESMMENSVSETKDRVKTFYSIIDTAKRTYLT